MIINSKTCICPNRILVQENIHDRFVERLAQKMTEQLKIGHGLDKDTTQGPLINKNALDKVCFICSGLEFLYLIKSIIMIFLVCGLFR